MQIVVDEGAYRVSLRPETLRWTWTAWLKNVALSVVHVVSSSRFADEMPRGWE